MRGLVLGLILLALAPVARAQAVDYGGLVGTWSEPGRCGTSLRVFTGEGRHLWLAKEGEEWGLEFLGVYVTWGPEQSREAGVRGAFVLAEGLDMGGFLFEVHALSADRLRLTYRGSENTDDEGGEQITWVRCPVR